MGCEKYVIAAYILDPGSNNSELSDILTVCQASEKIFPCRFVTAVSVCRGIKHREGGPHSQIFISFFLVMLSKI